MFAEQQRLQELVVLLSCYGEAMQEITPQELLQAARVVCDGDNAAEAAVAAHSSCSYSGVLHMTAGSVCKAGESMPVCLQEHHCIPLR